MSSSSIPPPLPPLQPPPLPPAAHGPGSPQGVPPLPGQMAIDPATLPAPIRAELQVPDPLAIGTAAAELKDGLNRCPKCGATDIRPKLGTDLLVCQYCRHTWDGARVEEAYGFGAGLAELRGTVIASGARNIQADANSLMSFKCSGCGAEVTINTDSAMTARCHWCRHMFGVNEQVANGAVPDAVLPFHIDKQDAVARIRQFVGKRRLFALKAFKQQFTPENVVGVYLPYMIVDGNVSASVTGVGEITTRTYTQGTEKNKKTYYDADIYAVKRQVEFTVDDLPLESSSERGNLDSRVTTNNIINTILPFDTKNAVQWNASYLSGFSSERRDSNIEQLRPRLEDQLLSIARAQVERSVSRYDRGVRWEREQLEVHGTRWVSMYLPVWLYSYHQPGRNGGLLHYIAVNGRTGETMGSVPVQQWKLLLAALVTGTVIEAAALWFLAVIA
ncbi:TFIIB-type zinc ribbon-containing protein [Xanthomonas campestris pv. incanae]|uniref:TFIIB-type zinc ribbon-containing protein n=1 Tax=Xanthomonas campestris TaxID=339 RepID=UPI0029C58E40|nr:TFIIB-type zinc ribbon-containing protein [Xanthomonas campestris]MDX6080991.1 TFIIB-type zinc ribbon-containing protein [Xanthomonas campestris pv. incanae]MDX6084998.1 TFIIB-type zinc ribbon-containing protein [Xanthomonas campestris pv. incanae]MDX6137801.1 TFIIB-type zinc ribbon-containing protein [Xanthomonas campestris pv. incanae]